MKKYEKPTIVIENFELSHSVAANCNPTMGHTQNSCKYESNELFGLIGSTETVFSGDCTYTIDEFTSIFEGYCLQTSVDGMNLFTS